MFVLSFILDVVKKTQGVLWFYFCNNTRTMLLN